MVQLEIAKKVLANIGAKELEKSGKLGSYTKKEQIQLMKEKVKLEKTLGGIKSMYKLPAALIVIDPKTDEIAVKEAMKLNIPVIALCDTNVDPDMVSLAIPGNDDIPEAINIIVNKLVEAYADAAGIKMQPSVLKTVAVRRENSNFSENHSSEDDKK
ncbi:hypothetical protein FQA39_LY12840 [Lamprigera yunnana]|nr:hypothetical protein FQA39_LY12840 [Lamprigera yunnana]